MMTSELPFVPYSIPFLTARNTYKLLVPLFNSFKCFSCCHSVEDVDKWHQKGQMYNVISCLNVLDRCDRPLSMLKQITDNLHPGGILIIALVLPYQPLVETYSIQTHPTEQLPLSNSSWEENVSTLWKKVLQPLGYLPVAVSRVPYISEGDLNKNYYTLDDVIFVLKRIT